MHVRDLLLSVVIAVLPVVSYAQIDPGAAPSSEPASEAATSGNTEAKSKAEPPSASTLESSDASAGDISPAAAAFEEGVSLFGNAQYIDASNKFREAVRLRPTFKIWFNIGQCETAAKRNGLAIEAFEKYLTLGGDEVSEGRRKAVVDEIARLKPIVGFLEVEAPEGATVFVDRVNRGVTPLPGPLMLAAAVEHEVIVTGGDAEATRRNVQVAGEQTVRISVGAVVTEPKPEESTEEAVPPKRSKLQVAGWAVFSVGAVTMAVGAAAGITAVVKSGKIDSECSENKCPNESYQERTDAVAAWATAADVLLAVGGTAVAGGLIAAIVGRKKSKSAGSAVSHVVPYVEGSGAGVFLSGSF